MPLPLLGFLAGGKILKFLKIGGAIVIILAIAIPVWLHIREDNRKDNMITALQGNVTQLETDKALLTTSNGSLQNEVARRLAENQLIIRENERFRAADEQVFTEMAELRRRLESKEREERIKKIRNSRAASLLLRKANSQAKCEWTNFDRFDGRCIEGKFVLTGERLVPLETKTPAATESEEN